MLTEAIKFWQMLENQDADVITSPWHSKECEHPWELFGFIRNISVAMFKKLAAGREERCRGEKKS